MQGEENLKMCESRLSMAQGRFLAQVNNVQLYYDITTHLYENGKNLAREKFFTANKSEFLKPEVKARFGENNPLLNDEKTFESFIRIVAERSIRVSQKIVGLTSI